MLIRPQAVVKAVVAALFAYLLGGGATFNGVLLPELKMLTLNWTALLALAWLVVRWRRGWKWHRTPMDGVFLLWALSFALSLLANVEIWRRIAIGLWYITLYVAVWYALHDLVANGAISREGLIDCFLIGGVIVLYFAYRQIFAWLAVQPDLAGALTRLPRPVGTIGNPNALGGLLVVLIPFALTRLVTASNRAARIVLAVYNVAAWLMLVLSGSRGAWVGIVAGMAVLVALLLSQRQLLSRKSWHGWWGSLTAPRRYALTGGAMLAVVGLLYGTAVLARSFSEAGRQPELRTAIYDAAIHLFLEKPVFGHGLFTFGRGLARMQSMPPETAHSHAHDVPLQIAAEQGIVGVAVLILTLVVLIRAMRRNWRATNGRNQTLLLGVIAAVVAFGVHQLTDIPAMMPAIALSGLLALALAVAPAEPVALTGWKPQAYPAGLGVLWFALLVTGYWSASVYTEYLAVLRYAGESEDYRGAAERMQPVIDADPSLALYHLEQGELFGLAASNGDLEVAPQGIAAYERFIALEPDYAIAWANLAALRLQTGDQEQAIEAMQRAVDLAPRSPQLAINLGNYLETAGQGERARQVYERILTVQPCANQYPEWEATPVRRDISSARTDTCVYERIPNTTPAYISSVLLALESNDRNSALNGLADAEKAVASAEDQAWVRLGWAGLARYDGDDATAERELDTATALLERGFLDNDYVDGINIAYSQYLRAAIQRLFLPQVYFPTADPVLLRLIAETRISASS